MSNIQEVLPGIPFGHAWMARVFLLSIRLGATLAITPILGGRILPMRARVLIILVLSAALSMLLPGNNADIVFLTAHPGLLVRAGLIELAIGLTLGLGILLAFGAYTIAGRLLDIQIGFGLGQVIDPHSNTRSPILTTTLNHMAVLLFFLVNGHHVLLRGLAYSLERFPLGQAWDITMAHDAIVRQAMGIFGLSFALAAPVVICLLLLEFALGVISRNLPQINMLILGIPIKIVAGLLALALWFTGMGPVMLRVYGSIYGTWDSIFAPQPLQKADR